MHISDQTMHIRLHQGGLHSRRPMRSFALNQRNRGNRRNWALAHLHWIIAELRNIMFADETRIGLRPDTIRVRVWRSARRPQEHRCVQEVHRFAGGSVMFWVAIMMGQQTPLIPIYGSLTGPRYLHEILQTIVRPYRLDVGDNFILVDDNTRHHRTLSTVSVSSTWQHQLNAKASTIPRHECN